LQTKAGHFEVIVNIVSLYTIEAYADY